MRASQLAAGRLAALLLAVIPPALASTDLWWCGATFSDAAGCSQPCPTGVGCPSGHVCFSGVTGCVIGTDANAAIGGGGSYCGSSLDHANRCERACPSGTADDCPPGEACFARTSCGTAEVGSVGVIDNLVHEGHGSGGGMPWTPPGSSSSASSSYASSSSSNSNANSNALAGITGINAVEASLLKMKDAINNDLFLYETPDQQWVPSTVYRFDGFFEGLQVMHSQGVAGKKLYLGGECETCHVYGLVNVAAFLAQAMKETIRYDACDENSWDRVGAEEMYPISNACGQLGQSYQDYHCSEEERHMECEVDPQMTITAVTNAKWWGAPGPLQCGPKSLYPQTGYWDFNAECDGWANPTGTCDAYVGQKGGEAVNNRPYPNAAGRTDVEGCCWWGRGVIQTSGICNFGKLNYFLGKRAADEGRESKYPGIDFCRDPEAICSSKEHQELKWIAGFFYWMSDVQTYDKDGWNYISELHKFVDGGMQGDAFINAVSGIVNRGCHNPPCGTGELDGGPERAKNFEDVMKEMQFSFGAVPHHPVEPATIAHTSNGPVSEAHTSNSLAAEEIRYSCGNYRFDASDTSIPPSLDVTFDYELHNGIDITVGDALRDAKASIMRDLADKMGCYKTSGRGLRSLLGGFDSIIALQSSSTDLPDSDAAGCIVDIETINPTACTPVEGRFTIYGIPGTSESSLQKVSKDMKTIIRTGMAGGSYETYNVEKAIYIGDRSEYSGGQSAGIYAQSEGGESNKVAIWVLAIICVVLLCLLLFAIWKYREKLQGERQSYGERRAFQGYMNERSGQRTAPPYMRQMQGNGSKEVMGRETSPYEDSYSESYHSPSESSAEDVPPMSSQRPATARSKSAPYVQSNSQRRVPQRAYGDDDSASSCSSESSGSENDVFVENKPALTRSNEPMRSSSARYSRPNASLPSLQGEDARELRQQRMAMARARASKRQSM